MSADSPTAPLPILVAGPTAVGKSAVAFSLAQKLGGEIVSVDSMQVYRGMDIGTAKPSAAERAAVPHHLLDVMSVAEPFSSAQFLELAKHAVREIRQRGRVPILCGGTGLYMKVFLEGLGAAPASNAALRAELESMPLPELLAELARKDPRAFERIDRRNPRRVIRAVEVIRLTGKPFSETRADWGPTPAQPAARKLCFGLARSADDLHARIDARVEQMFRDGLVEETERLLRQGLAGNRTALQALGYQQVAQFLAGQRPLDETIKLVKTRTRQFARRQMTYFRRQLPLTWVQVGSQTSGEEIATELQRVCEG